MEFAAKLAARKSKVEENHARLKNRKNRIREKEEKIRELESELNALDGEIKSKSDILKERETVSSWFKFWWQRRPPRFTANYYQYNFLSLEIEDAGIGGHGER